MRPRPRSRARPVDYVPPEVIVERIRELRREGFDPPAVLVGLREWNIIRVQPSAGRFLTGVCADELYLDGVQVIASMRWDKPRVVATWEEYREALERGR